MLPSRAEAISLLTAAAEHNPGPWIAHSYYTAQAAELLAMRHPQLDAEHAYLAGLLHDIGRRAGIMDMRHSVLGYHFLAESGYTTLARVCLTHSFPLQDSRSAAENWDGTDAEFAFLQHFLTGIVYDTYDRLIQLCDAVSLSTGFCLMEKRLVDVALRRGVTLYTVAKWRAFFTIQQEIEAAIGQSIYQVLPGVVETTFGRRPDAATSYCSSSS